MKKRRVTLVPHTHWDREWYLPFEAFRDRLVQVLDELLDRLDAGYPHFHLDGQTALVDDYLEVRPEREADFRRHAEAGRISLGPWLALVDEFLVSGETIVRALELGLARARELGGGDLVGYLPDQFGHIGQMPQILAAAGIDNAVVWRGVPRAIERTPFWWEAPDGSRVRAEYLPFGYSIGGHLRECSEARPLATSLLKLTRLLGDFSARDGVLVPAGSDHLPVDPTLPERLEAASSHSRRLEAKIGSLAGYLATPATGELPVWRGELRSAARAALLPGVYSTRIHQKRERAKLEALVERYAEPLAALVPGFEWPRPELDRAWRLLVLNGAHDSVCGCSVDEVARAVDARHAEVHALAEGIVEGALTALGGQVREPGALRFNPSPFEREGVPGLGWRVDAAAQEPTASAVLTDLRDGWVSAAGVELRLADEPDAGDLYNFGPAGPSVGPSTLALEADGVAARFDGVDVRLRCSRSGADAILRVDAVMDNRRPDHRLRLHLRLPRDATGSLAGSPFELAVRGLVSEGGDREPPCPTWPARGFVLAGGLAVLAEGVIEYEVVSERELAVTLLRCVGTISRQTISTRSGPAGPDIATPEAQLVGKTTLPLGLLPAPEPADLIPAWERFALPLRSAWAAGGGTLSATGKLLELEGAALSAVRRVDGAVEARVWNPSGSPARARAGSASVVLGPAAIARVRVE